MDTLSKFAAEMPEPEQVIIFEKDGSTYVEVVGRLPRFPTIPMPSGPPIYIFDSTGRIRFWTIDSGDSSVYAEEWYKRSSSREVSMQEALNLTQGVKQ